MVMHAYAVNISPDVFRPFLRHCHIHQLTKKSGKPDFSNNGGEGGIRTPDTLLRCTPLAGERLRPLGHLSAERAIIPMLHALEKGKSRMNHDRGEGNADSTPDIPPQTGELPFCRRSAIPIMVNFLQAKAPMPADATPTNRDTFFTAQGCDQGWISSRQDESDGSGNAKPRRFQGETSRFSFFGPQKTTETSGSPDFLVHPC